MECKHRRDGIKWVFAPEKPRPYDGPTRKNVFNLVDQLAEEYQLDRRSAGAGISTPLGGKGIEIKDSSSFDADIRAAFFQLRYGVIHLLREYIWSNVTYYNPFQDNVLAIVPILVTTADLWRFKDDVGYEEVRTADSFEDVAKSVDVVLVRDSPDPAVKRDIKTRLVKGATQKEMDDLQELLNKRAGEEVDMDYFLNQLVSCPRYFHVMNHSRFQKSFGNLLRFIGGFKANQRASSGPRAEDAR